MAKRAKKPLKNGHAFSANGSFWSVERKDYEKLIDFFPVIFGAFVLESR